MVIVKDADLEITYTANDKSLSHIGLALTESEARELRDTLDALLLDSQERPEHVASADFQRELTSGSCAHSSGCIAAHWRRQWTCRLTCRDVSRRASCGRFP